MLYDCDPQEGAETFTVDQAKRIQSWWSESKVKET